MFWIILIIFLFWFLFRRLDRVAPRVETQIRLLTEEDVMREAEQKRIKRKKIREELEGEQEKEKQKKIERKLQILDKPVETLKLDKPRNFKEFIDSSNLKKEIIKKVKSVAKNNQVLRHMIFWGVPGTGKSTMAGLIAKDMGVKLIEVAPKNLKEPQDLISLFQRLSKKTSGQGDIILMDEINMMRSEISELLNKALTDNQLVVTFPNGKTIKSNIPCFTLIGTTNFLSKLLNSLKSRCELLHFEPYTEEDIYKIIMNLAERYNVNITNEATGLLAHISQNIPRNAVMLYKNTLDYSDEIDITSVKKVMEIKGIDMWGLSKIQQKYLEAIHKSSKGKLSLTNVASIIQVEKKTVENDIEPYLKRKHFIEVGSGGRWLTKKGEEVV